ncbi:MAG: FeoB small GTPase domain-containing protein, partial [Pirellulaceae bacterium]
MNQLTIALVGNPNTGKSSLFNALAGLHQQVGNYPGVTVEKKVGQVQLEDTSLTLIDVPGTYSLVSNSPDEQIAVSVLLGS